MKARCSNQNHARQAKTIEAALNQDPHFSVALRADGQQDLGLLRSQVLRVSKQLSGASSALIYCEDSYNFLVGFLALAVKGINAILLPGESALQQLDEQGISDAPFISDRAGLSPDFLLDEWNTRADQASEQILQIASNWSFSIFTSGSSGQSKIFQKTPALLEAEIQDLEHLFGKQLGAAIICGSVSQQHIYGLLFRVLWPFCTGRTFYSELLRYPEQMQALELKQIALISSPSFLKRIPQPIQKPALGKFSHIFSSGGPLPEICAVELLQSTGRAPIEVLGSTETGGIAFRQRQHIETQPIWQSFPSVMLMCDRGKQQNLRIRSPFIDSALCDSAGLFSTADAVKVSRDGQGFQLLGRTDRIVKIEEKRISLPQVEQRLCSLDSIQDAAVVDLQKILPSGVARHCLGAVVQLKTALSNQSEFAQQLKVEIQGELRKQLEPLAIPRYFRFVDQIPEDAQGKRNSSILRALFDSAERHILHRQEISKELAQVQGHFPGMPLVPGFLQLDWVLHLCEETLALNNPGGFSQVKFLKPILPDSTAEVLIEIKPKGAHYEFLISSEQGLHSKGQLRFSSEVIV